MNVSCALFLLLLFLPTSAVVWVLPSYIVFVLLVGLAVVSVKRQGLDYLGKFLKTWGAMALFWAVLSTLASIIVAWEISYSQLQEGLKLFLRLLTLFLLAALLNRETTAVSLARAFSGLLRPLFKEKANTFSLAVFLTTRTLTRKIESLKRFRSGLKIRFPNKGKLFELRLLLLRLIEEIDISSEKLSEALFTREIEKEAFWNASVRLTKREAFLLIFVFLVEIALCFTPPWFL